MLSAAALLGVGSVIHITTGLWQKMRSSSDVDPTPCPYEHQMIGLVKLLHWAVVPCERALEIAQVASYWWENELREEFPGETRQPFELNVIYAPGHRGGGRPLGQARAIVNLAKQEDDEDMRSTLAEEIHHVARFLRFGDEPPVYEVKYDETPWALEKLLYYSLNPWEYFALKFACRVTSVPERLRLLVEARKTRLERGLEV